MKLTLAFLAASLLAQLATSHAAPLGWVKTKLDILMVQGDKDTTIPVPHAHYMQERAKAVKAPVEVLIVRNAEHNWRAADGAISPSLDEVVTKTAAFLKQQLTKVPLK